jgi:hypothetical protein
MIRMRYMKYIAVAAAALIVAFVVIASVVPGGSDRNVPGSTTGAGKTS